MTRFLLPTPEAETPPELHTLELESVKRYSFTQQRAAGDAPVPAEIADDAVVRVDLDDGFELWIRGDDLRKELGRPPSRGGDDAVWQLQPGIRIPAAERGIGNWALDALAVFDIKPQELAAEKLAALAEKNNKNILKRIDSTDADDWTPVDGQVAPPANDGAALLLFIHGTFSSTEGSFGELLKNPS